MGINSDSKLYISKKKTKSPCEIIWNMTRKQKPLNKTLNAMLTSHYNISLTYYIRLVLSFYFFT